MAAYANTIEYASSATYGSVAYDLGRYGGTAIPKEYPREIEEPVVEEKARTQVKTRVRAVERQRVSAFGVVGSVVLTLLVVLLLMAYVQLNEISAQTVEIQNTIAELENENTKLTSEFEMTFNMSSVKDYAINVLGMTEPTAEQITVLNMGTTDRAEIINVTNAGNSSASESVGTFLTTVLEYFK